MHARTDSARRDSVLPRRAESYARVVVALTAATLLAGCGSGHATRPANLPPIVAPASTKLASKVGPSACPDISGRYETAGTLAPDTPQELCKSALHSAKYRDIGDWECERDLELNLAGSLAGFGWVEVSQPDPDAVIVTMEAASFRRELHRSKGDFDCTAEGITRKLTAAMTSQGEDEGQEGTALRIYNGFSAATNALIATGGVQSLTRTFMRAADGSLVMHVERKTHGLFMAIPVDQDYSTYVTWPRHLETPPPEPPPQ